MNVELKKINFEYKDGFNSSFKSKYKSKIQIDLTSLVDSRWLYAIINKKPSLVYTMHSNNFIEYYEFKKYNETIKLFVYSKKGYYELNKDLKDVFRFINSYIDYINSIDLLKEMHNL